MKIKVIIEEHISREMEIEADDLEDAMERAEDLYYNGEFIVDNNGIPSCVLMMADDGEIQTEWTEI